MPRDLPSTDRRAFWGDIKVYRSDHIYQSSRCKSQLCQTQRVTKQENVLNICSRTIETKLDYWMKFEEQIGCINNQKVKLVKNNKICVLESETVMLMVCC